jgi:hypothetical protein
MKKRTFKDLFEKALKYKTRGEFQKKDFNSYQIASKRGKAYLSRVCPHMPKRVDQSGENNFRFKWSLEKIQIEANKYSDRKSFKKGNPKAYGAACDKGVLSIVCKNMPPASNQAYTYKELYSLCKKYDTIAEFRKHHPGAYTVIARKGYWKNMSLHMNKKSASSAEKMILEEILKHFPEAKKFLATKLKVPNKPHIKKLEVDILVPSLGKAIEFDGRYHHSFEGLRRGHPTWSDEDVRDYHEIKDEAFLSIDIQILHIKEKDWRKDKEKCIKKCLDFLGVNKCQ